MIITFTTTGYGDIFPSTHLGRLMSAMSMFFGQFMISLILLAMSISAQFTLEEQKAFKSLKDIDYYCQKAKLAGHILTVYTLIRFCERQVEKGHAHDEMDEADEADESGDNRPKLSDRK